MNYTTTTTNNNNKFNNFHLQVFHQKDFIKKIIFQQYKAVLNFTKKILNNKKTKTSSKRRIHPLNSQIMTNEESQQLVNIISNNLNKRNLKIIV